VGIAAIIEVAIGHFSCLFSLALLENTCPPACQNMILRVSRNLKAAGKVECLGCGHSAAWHKRGNVPKGG
jgi:hypothetical protein